jgi:probable F420-dependent oxidoreductase
MYATESGSEWAALAMRAEDSGFDVLTLSDHIAGIINREFSRFAAIPALAAAAMCTQTIRFSMFVLCNDFRHPVNLAKEIATIDVLSHGRIELGLGAGWDAAEYQELGIDFAPGPARVTRLFEAVKIFRALWDTSEPVTLSSDSYHLNNVEVWPKPVQARIPIMVGGGGPVLLKRAAKVADIVSLMTFNAARTNTKRGGDGATLRAVREQISWIREAADDRLNKLVINSRANIFCQTDDRDAAARSMLGAAGFASVEDLLDSPYSLVGTPRQMADQILRQRDELGITYVAVNQPDLDGLAPVIDLVNA